MQLHWDKQMNASYQALARQSPNKAFYWFYAAANYLGTSERTTLKNVRKSEG